MDTTSADTGTAQNARAG